VTAPTIAVAVHDGFYGAGTGAGYSNRAFLQILSDALAPGVQLVVLPVRLTPSSGEYDSAWHQQTLALLARVALRFAPSTTAAAGRCASVACPRSASSRSAPPPSSPARSCPAPTRWRWWFDVPFLGVPPLLPPKILPHVTVVPRSSTLLHDPDDADRVRFERHGLLSVAHHGGRVAAISAHMREHLRDDYHLPEAALVGLIGGLTAPERQVGCPDPALIPVRGQTGFLLAMGRAQPYKGWDDLVDALALLQHEQTPLPHALLAAVTEDAIPSDYQRHLATRVAALGVDATLLTRFDPKIRDLLGHHALRAVVAPSRTEPFGRIPIEAYAAGAAPSSLPPPVGWLSRSSTASQASPPHPPMYTALPRPSAGR